MDALYIIKVLGYASLFIILIQSALTLFFGDLDIDGAGPGDITVSDVCSFKGIIHFIFGFSWTVFCYNEVTLISCSCGVVIGILFVFLILWLYKLMKRMESVNEYEERYMLVGRSCEILLHIEDNSYQVFIERNGSFEKMIVVSLHNTQYQQGDIVNIIREDNDILYIA